MSFSIKKLLDALKPWAEGYLMELTKCYRKSSSIVSRNVAKEIILVPIRQNVGDLQCIYTMNGVGARIWGLLDSEGTVVDIVSTITREYEVEQRKAETEVADFLAKLESIEAISPV
jgi:hypothetical protein